MSWQFVTTLSPALRSASFVGGPAVVAAQAQQHRRVALGCRADRGRQRRLHVRVQVGADQDVRQVVGRAVAGRVAPPAGVVGRPADGRPSRACRRASPRPRRVLGDVRRTRRCAHCSRRTRGSRRYVSSRYGSMPSAPTTESRMSRSVCCGKMPRVLLGDERAVRDAHERDLVDAERAGAARRGRARSRRSSRRRAASRSAPRSRRAPAGTTGASPSSRWMHGAAQRARTCPVPRWSSTTRR